MKLVFQDLGRMAYRPALEVQRRVHAAVLAGEHPPSVLFVEHHPVITIPKRRGAADHLLADAALLAREGVVVESTDRGGDITYHGPGQLVIYPLLPLNRWNFSVHAYVRLLEEVLIRSVASFGIAADRDASAVGVWIGGTKLAAVGVRVKRWVSLHGAAINVTTNLAHFDLIVPCGLAGRSVTSLQKLLGEQCPSMEEVKEAVACNLSEALNERNSHVTREASGNRGRSGSDTLGIVRSL